MSNEENNRGVVVGHHHHHHSDPEQPPPQYGTFQGVANYPPPPPPYGFPQPTPPPGLSSPPPQYYAQGYQTVEGYAVADGRPVREPRLPCCGIGTGWFLFIIGFFLGSLPWYFGLLVLICGKRMDYREKPGFIACSVAATLTTIAIIIGATKGADDW
ncbi:hypothetical protein ACFE04_009499 [Oxalis oulophora]